MSSSSWIELLKKAAKALARNRNHAARIALLGIGNEINGDDGVGVRIVRSLSRSLSEQDELKSPILGDQMSPILGDHLLVEAGLAPENFTGTLRRFQPDLVVLIDAAEMGLPAGKIACLDWREAGGWSASTHTLPLNMLSAFLVSELGCQVMLVGVQPLQMGMDQPLSGEVELAMDEIVAELQRWLKTGN